MLTTPLQHSLAHVDCPACEAAERSAIPTESVDAMGRVRFRDAWPEWLAGRKRIAAGTRESYRQYFEAAEKFFGSKALAEITIEDVVAYQAVRSVEIHAWRARHNYPAATNPGASRINHEIAALGQVLERAGLWEAIKRRYEPIPLPREGPGIALTEEEEQYVFEVASKKPRWLVAYCADLISLGTTAGPGEIAHIRIRDIDLSAHVLKIQGERKTVFRERTVPLEGDALWGVVALLERYRKAMAKAGIAEDPDHFLLYHRAHHRGAPPDPTRPMGSWKRAHHSLRAEVAKKYPRLGRLRRYDFRHTGATKMLEDPATSYSTIERMMGHKLGSRTKQIYDHVRDKTLRRAAVLLDGGHTRPPQIVVPPAEIAALTRRKPPRPSAGNPTSNAAAEGF